jgi:hypothetical protein
VSSVEGEADGLGGVAPVEVVDECGDHGSCHALERTRPGPA